MGTQVTDHYFRTIDGITVEQEYHDYASMEKYRNALRSCAAMYEADNDENMEIVNGIDREHPSLRVIFYKDSTRQEVHVEHEWYLKGHE